MQVTFDRSAKKFILDTFNKTINKDGDIVEKSNPAQKVLTQEGLEISEEEFGGIAPGSTIFIKNDLPSIVKLADKSKTADGNTEKA